MKKRFMVLVLFILILIISGCQGPEFSMKVPIEEKISLDLIDEVNFRENLVATIDDVSYNSFSLKSNQDSYLINFNKLFTGSSTHYSDLSEIHGLAVSGNVLLKHKGSYARFIGVTEDKREILIFDATSYPKKNLEFEFESVCEESCLLNSEEIEYFKVELYDAELNIDSLNVVYDRDSLGEDVLNKGIEGSNKYLLSLQAEEKINEYNEYNIDNDEPWMAGRTGVESLTYAEKKKLFFNHLDNSFEGDVDYLSQELPNVNGYFFYKGGFYIFHGSDSGDNTIERGLISGEPYSFDWRDKHGARNPSSSYYDPPGENQTESHGWLTFPKNQGGCGSCWAHGIFGAMEAVIDIISNQHLNLDLSEQYLVSCCSSCGGCSGGSFFNSFSILRETGAIPEWCFPYAEGDVPCTPCAELNNNRWKISNDLGLDTSSGNDYYEIKKDLIESGPLYFTQFHGYSTMGHAITLVGFGDVVPGNYTGPMNSPIVIEEEDELPAHTYFLIKNSYGDTWGEDNGYGKVIYEGSWELGSVLILPPIYDPNGTIVDPDCKDEDGDSYCNWGLEKLGKPSSGCPSSCNGNSVMDCDDFNSSIQGCPPLSEMICGPNAPYLPSGEIFGFGALDGSNPNFYYPSFPFYGLTDCCGDHLGEVIVDDKCCSDGNKKICNKEILRHSFSFGDDYIGAPQDMFIFDSEIYVLYSGNGDAQIRIFDLSGNYLRSIGSSGHFDGELYAPTGFDTDGEKIYVVSKGHDRVSVFNLDGSFLGWIGKCLNGPNCNSVNQVSFGFNCTGSTCCADHVTGSTYELNPPFNLCNSNKGLKCHWEPAQNYCQLMGFDNYVVDGYTCSCPSNCGSGCWANDANDPWHLPCGPWGNIHQWIDTLQCYGDINSVGCVGQTGTETGQFNKVHDILVHQGKLYIVDGIDVNQRLQVFDSETGVFEAEYLLPTADAHLENYRTLSFNDGYIYATTFYSTCSRFNLNTLTWSDCPDGSYYYRANRLHFTEDGPWRVHDNAAYLIDENSWAQLISLGGDSNANVSFGQLVEIAIYDETVYLADNDNSAVFAFEPTYSDICSYSPDIVISGNEDPWPLFESRELNAEAAVCGNFSNNCTDCQFEWIIDGDVVSTTKDYVLNLDYSITDEMSIFVNVTSASEGSNYLEFDFYPGYLGESVFDFNEESPIVTKSEVIYLAEDNMIKKFDFENSAPLGGFGSYGSGNGQFNEVTDFVIFDNNFYVVDSQLNRVQKFDLNGTFIGWMGKCTSGENCDIDNQRSQGFSCTEDTCFGLSSGNEDGQFNYPTNIDIESERIYVSDNSSNRIQSFNLTSGEFLDKFHVFFPFFDMEITNNQVYFTQACLIFSTDLLGNLILVVQGCTTPDQYGPFCSRGNITDIFINDNFLFTVSPSDYRVIQFSMNGGFVSSFGTDGGCQELDYPNSFSNPVSIHVDENKHLFVLDTGRGKVLKFGNFVLDSCGDGVCNITQGDSCAGCSLDCNNTEADCGSDRICREGNCQLLSCGDGNCSIELNETCANCISDCNNTQAECEFGYLCLGGSCQLPGCGDGICNLTQGELCSNCEDCYGEQADCQDTYTCLDGSCEQTSCYDGTLIGECSYRQPFYCGELPYCGDGVVFGDESCDMFDLNNQSCIGLGYDDGSLSCLSNCSFDESSCHYYSCMDNDNDTYIGYDIIYCPSGNDCNDSNEFINPGGEPGYCDCLGVPSEEVCENEIDEDCNGEDLICPEYNLVWSDCVNIYEQDCSQVCAALGKDCVQGCYRGVYGHDFAYAIFDTVSHCTSESWNYAPDNNGTCGSHDTENLSRTRCCCGELLTCVDGDGDGYNISDTYCPAGNDCNDSNEHMNPSGEPGYCDCIGSPDYDICENGVDEDCDGEDLECLDCEHGQIISNCFCGGILYDPGDGYCCWDIFSNESCPPLEYTEIPIHLEYEYCSDNSTGFMCSEGTAYGYCVYHMGYDGFVWDIPLNCTCPNGTNCSMGAKVFPDNSTLCYPNLYEPPHEWLDDFVCYHYGPPANFSGLTKANSAGNKRIQPRLSPDSEVVLHQYCQMCGCPPGKYCKEDGTCGKKDNPLPNIQEIPTLEESPARNIFELIWKTILSFFTPVKQ